MVSPRQSRQTICQRRALKPKLLWSEVVDSYTLHPGATITQGRGQSHTMVGLQGSGTEMVAVVDGSTVPLHGGEGSSHSLLTPLVSDEAVTSQVVAATTPPAMNSDTDGGFISASSSAAQQGPTRSGSQSSSIPNDLTQSTDNGGLGLKLTFPMLCIMASLSHLVFRMMLS